MQVGCCAQSGRAGSRAKNVRSFALFAGEVLSWLHRRKLVEEIEAADLPLHQGYVLGSGRVALTHVLRTQLRQAKLSQLSAAVIFLDLCTTECSAKKSSGPFAQLTMPTTFVNSWTACKCILSICKTSFIHFARGGGLMPKARALSSCQCMHLSRKHILMEGTEAPRRYIMLTHAGIRTGPQTWWGSGRHHP